MVDGMELVSNLITRYAVLEKLYLRTTMGIRSVAQDQFENATLELYTAVLKYLSKARRYYDRKTSSASIYILFLYFLLNEECRTYGIECRSDGRIKCRRIYSQDLR
jgi:hypothetical protein